MHVALAMLMCFVCVGSASVSHDVVNELQAELQALLDTLAQQSGFAIQLGVKTPDYEFSIASGSATIPGKQAKQITVNDTMAFGSATKPYTATAVMQLVEKGVLSLDDPAMKHIDPILQKLNGTTLVKLFGTEAAQITVGHVLQMRSGIADFDVPEFDYKVLADDASNPLELILYAAGLTPKFVCKPGTCVCYSSTNYELAGLILLAHAAKGEDTWQTFDQSVVFPSKLKSEFAHTFFENNGLISDHLTVPGTTRTPNGTTKVFSQHASILGWTCGNLVATVMDVTRFYYELLQAQTIVSPATLKGMMDFKPLDVGWAKGHIKYGTGLMVQTVSGNYSIGVPVNDADGSYIGHGGDTYGFLSENGYYPALGITMATIANQDINDPFVSNTVACKAIEVATKVLKGRTIDLQCMPAVPKYTCYSQGGKKMCYPSAHGTLTQKDCASTCK